ncbi:MAG TPA: DUF3322 domain-containing protein [Acidiferrobacter sp.]|nr:DUF3322 domain-containing protein [Acidiferrobacter sp.]
MSWTRASDLRAQLQRQWDRGEILSSLVSGKALFPRRLTLKGPTSTEMADRFDEVRAWVAELLALSHYRIAVRQVNHRSLGANSLPTEAWVDQFDDAVALLSKRHEVARFSAVLETTQKNQPSLLGWLWRKPLRALDYAAEWERLLAIVVWLQAHPRPDIYLRQVDITGVDSKFIETHRGILRELLDVALPVAAIDGDATDGGEFARRYGFRDKPLRIRLRLLDPEPVALPFGRDVTLDAERFSGLTPAVSRVFITENEINFLAFPEARDSMVIFGGGYGFTMLRQAHWLADCRIYYWGDIDTHGFAILDQLRGEIDGVESFLMDRATLLAFPSQWGREDRQVVRDLPRLHADEQRLFDDLRDNRIAPNLRLEQERVGFSWVEQALAKLV